jgi:GTPase
MEPCANSKRNARIVAIVGRPNVGKSSLFNRLAGQRIAIVHAESGVTRDRLIREAQWNNERFLLVDTGGIGIPDPTSASAEIDAGIRRQAESAIEEAAAVVLVTDAQCGLHPMDEEVANLLHRQGSQAVVAVNKSDDPGFDHATAEFARLGFPVVAVSAVHNRGIDELMDAILPMLPAIENPTQQAPLRVAIVGRPNVGKSSYINRLLRSDRVIVSSVPGTTRDSIEIPFSVGRGPQARHYLLIDTAGIRRAGKIDTSVERFSLMRSERSIRDATVVVLVMDALQGPTAYDKKIAALINTHRRGCVILVNKWDLAEGQVTQRQYGPALVRTLPFMGHCPVIFASAQSGYNVKSTIAAIDQVAGQVTGTLPTGVLNRAIQDAATRVSPPATGGRRIRIYYATQVGADPIQIRIFVNRPDLMTPAYETYLIKSLREHFGLEGAPVVLQFRPRREAAHSGAPS